jgi:hypothetical protein
MVIYYHSMVIPVVILFYNTEWWYNYEMVVNYAVKSFMTLTTGAKCTILFTWKFAAIPGVILF